MVEGIHEKEAEEVVSEIWKPHGYQKRAVKWIRKNPGAALFLDPGMGKTSISLRNFVDLHKKGELDRMLVLCPLSAVNVWAEEAMKWKFSNGLRVEILHGTKKAEILQRPAEIQVINYDGLQWLNKQRNYVWPSYVTADESTKLKDTRTNRFGFLKPRLQSFARKVALTGTPRPKGLEDLFGQLYYLDRGARLGPYIGRFRNTYFTEVAPFKWVPRPDADEEIQEKISDICMYVDPDDHLDLPPITINQVRVDLPKRAMAQYKQFEDRFILTLLEGTVAAVNAAVKSGKGRQIAGGAVYTRSEEEDSWETIHNAKIDALMDRLEESSEPTFVLYEFKHELERIEEALTKAGWEYARITGSPKQRAIAVDRWNAGELDVLLAHPQAAAHALNLQHGGRREIWFGPTWNAELWYQAIRRVYRQGQEDHVFIDILVARGTSDEHVFKTCTLRESSQKSFMQGLNDWAQKKAA